jgi:Flp pilus assembly protein TadD
VFGNLADAYYWAPGRRQEAPAAFERAAAVSRERLGRKPADDSARLWLAFDLAMLGRRKESLAALGEALDRHPSDPHYSYFAARILNRLGEREEALDRLQRAVEGGWPLGEIRFSVEFDELRDEPRFQKLLDSR